jgi:hypothetical protein
VQQRRCLVQGISRRRDGNDEAAIASADATSAFDAAVGAAAAAAAAASTASRRCALQPSSALLVLSSWFRSTSSGRVDFRSGTAPDKDDENAHRTAFNTTVDVLYTDSPARDHSDDLPNTLC